MSWAAYDRHWKGFLIIVDLIVQQTTVNMQMHALEMDKVNSDERLICILNLK